MSSQFGYFGKVPSQGDFVKFNSGIPEVQSVDQWVQDGMYSLRVKLGDWKEPYSTTKPYKFIIPLESKTLMGTIHFSCDKSGREYPFVMHSLFDRSIVPDQQYLLPLFHNQECDFLSYSYYDKINNDPAFLPTQKNNTVTRQELEEQYISFMKKSQTVLWTALFADPDDELKYVLIDNLFNSNKENYLGRIPYPGNILIEYFCACFISLIMRIKHKTNARFTVFWNDDIFFLYMNGIKKISFSDLVSPQTSEAENIVPDIPGSTGTFLFKRMLDDNNLSIKDLINNL